MELLSENIVAKFYNPYRNIFDVRVPSSGLRGASERVIFHRLKTLKSAFSQNHIFQNCVRDLKRIIKAIIINFFFICK